VTTPVRRFGDIDLAEEAVRETFAAAVRPALANETRDQRRQRTTMRNRP